MRITLSLIMFMLLLKSCSNLSVSEEIVKQDFEKRYPDYEYVSSGVGEGDLAVNCVHVKYRKSGSDEVFEEEWQYWKTNESWVIRHEYLGKAPKDRFFNLLDSTDYSSLDFTLVSEKEWDKLLVLQPYANIKHLNDSLQIRNIREIKNVGMEYRDDVSLVLFINRNLIVEYFTCPRRIDFSEIGQFSGYGRDEAVFNVMYTGRNTVGGSKIYTLSEKSNKEN